MKFFTVLSLFVAFSFVSCDTEECVKCYEARNVGGANETITELETRCGCEIHEFNSYEGYEGDIKIKRYCDE